MSEGAMRLLKSARYDRCVIVERGQLLWPEAHLGFAWRFGERWMPPEHPTGEDERQLQGYPAILAGERPLMITAAY
jgi:hypothetical protein